MTQLTELFIIAGYLAALLVLGIFASSLFRGTKQDYLLASHSIGPFLLLMSLFGTTMTAFALVGSTGEAFKEGVGVYGLLASSSGIIHSLCFFVIGVKIWSYGKRYGYSTQIEYFRDRLDDNHIGLLLFPILVGLVVPYLLIGVISSGEVVQKMTAGALPDLFPTNSPATNGGVPKWLGSGVICCVVLIYVFFGGMRGTAWANAFQTMVFMVLGVVTFYVIAMKFGKQDTLLASLQACTEKVSFEKLTRVEMSQSKFLTYMLVPFSVAMFPHLFQHWLTAKSAASFKLPVVAHPVFIMIVWVPCVLIGVWATTDLIQPGPPLPKTPDGAVNVNAILPFLVKSKTGPVLGGFLAAGILAAIMSSLDSQFLCIGTIFSNDIVGHYIGKDKLSDKTQVLLARSFIVMIVVVTYLLALLPHRSVFNLGVWCFSGFAALFPLVFASLYWKRLTAAGAYAQILTVILSWSYFFWKSKFGGDRDFSVNILGFETMPVLTIFVLGAVAMVIVSLITRPPREETLSKFFA